MRSPRVEFSPTVKKQILSRASIDGVLRCEECGRQVARSGGEIDHTVAEWTRSATPTGERRPLTQADGRFLCRDCHRRKSAGEAGAKKRVDRARKRHRGAKKTKHPFRGWKNFKGEIVWASKRE